MPHDSGNCAPQALLERHLLPPAKRATDLRRVRIVAADVPEARSGVADSDVAHAGLFKYRQKTLDKLADGSLGVRGYLKDFSTYAFDCSRQLHGPGQALYVDKIARLGRWKTS